ncbi:GNAT family N-acetyltransferase [Longispora albida]|uniref:GNAT family N-acetyltransferase n=1 Tax=Longispora albida TaxID=203523 RepID=UPI000366D4F6|nr:GNAT family N-acetyltransferase [Longispora albida]
MEDPLLVWAAQGDARTFTHGDAIAVASPGLSRRDRLAVAGPPADLAALVPDVLAEIGPTYRPIGAVSAVTALCQQVPCLTLVDKFGWMDLSGPPTGPERGRAGWLAAEDDKPIGKLLDAAWPSAHARPGVDGVRRWAGLRDCAGRLAACAADAWSAPTLGFLTGVATHPEARGRGYAADVCAFTLQSMIEEYGRAALVVDGWNYAAIRLYRHLGLTYREFAAARVC